MGAPHRSAMLSPYDNDWTGRPSGGWPSPYPGGPTWRQYAEGHRARLRSKRLRPGDTRSAERRGLASCLRHAVWADAAKRAETGDPVAARRLAWIEAVYTERRHVDWLFRRLRAHDTAVRRVSEGACAACPACAQRIAKAQKPYDYFAGEIAKRAEQSEVPVWASWRREHPIAAPHRATRRLRVILGGKAEMESRNES